MFSVTIPSKIFDRVVGSAPFKEICSSDFDMLTDLNIFPEEYGDVGWHRGDYHRPKFKVYHVI
jgi:hypothetical protein